MVPPACQLSMGERVAFYRRRRGLSQVALAGLVGRTESWIEKVEGGRAQLDRVSVIRQLAHALRISAHDLIVDTAERPPRPTPSTGTLSYRALNPRLVGATDNIPVVGAAQLRDIVDDAWTAYQDSRFSYVIMRLNQAIPAAYRAAQRDDQLRTAARAQAQLYHVAATLLVKVGDIETARLCAERGDMAASQAGDALTRLSLQRCVAHALLSAGHFEDAVAVVRDGIADSPRPSAPAGLSALGTLMLVGATSSARAGERREAATFIKHASDLAEGLGRDGNHVWTAFGPTNVAIHDVAVAAELGDLHRAASLGGQLNIEVMPRERRVRHRLELARIAATTGRLEDALSHLLQAEADAPEQVREHFLTSTTVGQLIRSTRTRPSADLVALARRLGHAA